MRKKIGTKNVAKKNGTKNTHIMWDLLHRGGTTNVLR
jgi:hypothetical protein